MPRRVKKRRQLTTETGTRFLSFMLTPTDFFWSIFLLKISCRNLKKGADAGWEEYWDYIFPEEEAAKPNMKLLEMAKKWKQKQATDEPEEKSEEPMSAEN